MDNSPTDTHLAECAFTRVSYDKNEAYWSSQLDSAELSICSQSCRYHPDIVTFIPKKRVEIAYKLMEQPCRITQGRFVDYKLQNKACPHIALQ